MSDQQEESEKARFRRFLEDTPTLAKLLADAGLRKQYTEAVKLLDSIGYDSIMREISDATLGEPPSSQDGILARALAEEQRLGFNKARRAIRHFLEVETIQENIPNTPDYGSDDALRKMGYDPSTIKELE